MGTLSDEETYGSAEKQAPTIKDNIGETHKLQDHSDEVLAELGDGSVEGLSWLMKISLAGVVLALCYGWVRMHGRRSNMHAGRHGAYEKGGLA